MKKIIFSLVMAILALVSVNAQQISVVSPAGETTICRTLPEAIEGAADGSVVYLPGGGFSISDSVKITKKLTIIGIGHKSNNSNVDGVTTINGNLFFNEGSSKSAVMACYITGNIIIGDEDASVNDVLVRYCNLNSVQVKNSSCKETFINQNYIRNSSNFGESNAIVKNNVLHSIGRVNEGFIMSNVILNGFNNYSEFAHFEYSGIYAYSTVIKYNIIPCKNESNGAYYYQTIRGENNTIETNMCRNETGDNPINIGDIAWEDLFIKYSGISPTSDFHFTEDFKTYENEIGIYSGTGFNENQLAPVPYIIYKDIPEQTDSEGKLKIQIRVKANQ